MKYVIIGFGVAGIAAVEAIRSVDDSGTITLISNDPHGYYSRPGLAYYLTGELHHAALYPRSPKDFAQLKFQTLLVNARGIDRQNQAVVLDGKPPLPYDRLLLATGAQALPLKVPGANLEGVLKLDHLSDAKAIMKHARRGKTAVVVGGGITALELVEGLVARGMKVHYLLRGDRYWSNVLDEQESHIVEHRLQEEGVKLHYHAEITEIIGKQSQVKAVHLQSGEIINCELIAYAIGIRPRIELAKQAGLGVDRGILVDNYMQTNDPNIFSAGDVAQTYDPSTGTHILDSLWTPARQQGYAAGLNMAGKKTQYLKGMSFNVTRLAGLTTTIIGTVGQGRDEDIVGIARGDSEIWRHLPDAMIAQSDFEVNRLRLVVGEKTLLGAIVMGDQKLSFPLEKIISEKVDITPIRSALLELNANVGNIVAGFWEVLIKERRN
jgi:3-phenylpropionate/trans-cinnamate dioxygenase ferredoxin reductase component